jgi:transmembrane sensor
MVDLSKLFGSRARQPEKLSPGNPTLEKILEGQSRRLRTVDPNTGRQWQYLSVVLHRASESGRTYRPGRRFGLLSPALSYGGVLAIVLVIASFVWLNRSSVLTYETGKGQQSSIILSDSSEVTLNHTSTLIVESRPFGRTRHVSLKGEAFFHVRRNGAPFIVTTDLGSIQVLGTQFDVHMRGEQLIVGVLNGSVEVSARRGGRDSAVVLNAGQILTCPKEGFPGAPADLPFADYPGWVQGKMFFYRTSLLSACKEIESRFDVRIHFGDPRLGLETITGVVDGRSAETAVMALSNLTGNKFRHENNIYTLY